MARLEDASTTDQMIVHLGSLFRHNLRTKRQQITLEEELDGLEDYIYLQQMRFDGRIAVEKKHPVQPAAVLVPSFMLQPVVENAYSHGLKSRIGNPAPFGFRTPDEVIYDMRQQLTECEGYSPAKGLFAARKAIMQYAQLKNIPNVTIEDIYTGNGVSELINLSMSALLDDGDEILIPSPDYPLWTACATLAGGKSRPLSLRRAGRLVS